MCCNATAHSRSGAAAQQCTSDHVDQSLVATPLPDGYWLSAFPFSSDAEFPDLVGYGLGFAGKPASVRLFLNPKNTGLIEHPDLFPSATDFVLTDLRDGR
jgi:hypothetical protein